MKMAKCVVWDLDDTLWSGTLSAGDEVVLKPGVAEVVRQLDERGILQSIASKNNHDDAWSQLEEFGLAEFFLHPQINWAPKSASVQEIWTRLNINPDTVLFVDDQPFERDEVAFHHAEVETVDAVRYRELTAMPRLSPEVVTEDARRRRLMYVEDQARSEREREYGGPHEDFLCELAMEFRISLAGPDDLARLEELTRRTNQLNSTGIQYSREELDQLRQDSDHDLWVCELSDRYGSYGKIGLALVHRTVDVWTIRLLLMSCRTVSKGSGTVLLSFLGQEAARAGVRLCADFRRTDRNRQMLVTYQLANFRAVWRNGNDYRYENDMSSWHPYPDFITVTVDRDPRTQQD